MTVSPFQDEIAIDTNVFEHILNAPENAKKHISYLLVHLSREGVRLLVDDSRRIEKEYSHRLKDRIIEADEKGIERLILRYWLIEAPKCYVESNRRDPLMTIIRNIILNEPVDQLLVYVALVRGKVLVTNDLKDIVNGPHREDTLPPRRDRVLQQSKRKRPKGGDILTSLEAFERIEDLVDPEEVGYV